MQQLPDGLDQKAAVGIPRHDRRAVVAPLQQRGPRIEPQPPLFIVGMALVAVPGENRPDPRLEKVRGQRSLRRLDGGSGGRRPMDYRDRGRGGEREAGGCNQNGRTPD